MLQYCYSYTCSLDLTQTVVITGGGGRNTMSKVTEYNEDGKSKELKPLITGRMWHGCSSFIDKDGNIVSRHR